MEQKKLYRKKDDSTIGGVCSGIAEYFNIEPIIIQALFFLLIWTPVPIITTYIFLWIFMKKEPNFK
jgi:phage shock protein PspC (stress-responsive transcriptional regulator)